MNNKSIFLIGLIVVFTILIGSCSPKTTVFVQPSGSVVVGVDVKTSKTMDALIESFAQFSEEEKQKKVSIFNAGQIKIELEKQGLEVLSVKTNSLAGIFAKFKISQKDTQDENAFVKTDMKKGSLLLRVGRQNVNEFAQMLSEDDREYLNLLMAPVFTEEKLTVEEYEELIKYAYGEKLFSELKKSAFSIAITCPKKVTGIEVTPFGKGTKNGNKAFVKIPLSYLLCIQEPIFINVKFTP